MDKKLKESNVIDKVISTINKNELIESGDKIVVAVSGGPDSICLLDVLIKIFKLKKLPRNPEPWQKNCQETRNRGNCCGTC